MSVKGAISRLEGWKTFSSRTTYVNDVRYQMVEISIRAIQQVIDILKEAEGG